MKTIKNLVLIALAATSLLLTPASRAADENSDATINWTKHITAFLPLEDARFATIAGVVGGDTGDGTVIGDAFRPLAPLDGGRVTFEAEYHIVGAQHSLTIRFRAIQSPDLSGVLIGVVTEGWLKGNVVTGTYQGRNCDEGVNLHCFDGTFTIQKGTKAKD